MDENIDSTTQDSEQISTPIPQTSKKNNPKSRKWIYFLGGLILGVVITGLLMSSVFINKFSVTSYVGNDTDRNNTTADNSVVDLESNNTVLSEEKSEIPISIDNEAKESVGIMDVPADLYVNEEYGFSFILFEGERAIACEEDFPELNNVNLSVYVTEREPISDLDFDECASGVPLEGVFVNKIAPENALEDYIEGHESEEYAYEIKTFDIDISGIEATEVVGIRDTTNPAPLPDRIDEILLENDGMFYIISESFLERDIEIL